MPEPAIRPSTALHNAAFMERHWPAYDRPLGIEWEEERLHIRAEDEAGRTLGIASYSVVGGLGRLQQILVDRSWARRGIGAQLLLAFERDCVGRRCHKLRLETGEYQARGFYERYGWRVAATLERDRFRRTWYVMARVLSALRRWRGGDVESRGAS